MRRSGRFPGWGLMLVSVLGIMSHCLQGLGRFAIRHHAVLTNGLEMEMEFK